MMMSLLGLQSIDASVQASVSIVIFQLNMGTVLDVSLAFLSRGYGAADSIGVHISYE
jgi:hypothetical protein